MRYPRKRDAGERAIIEALKAAGCSVTQLDGSGVPDLVVGLERPEGPICLLLEVKDEIGEKGGKSRDGQKLTPTQQAWWGTWKGQVAIVRTPEEALAVVFPEMVKVTA